MNNNREEQIPQRFIQLICEENLSKWKVDANIILFSKYLAEMEPQNNDKCGCMMRIQLPAFLKMSESAIPLIIKFMKMHNFNPQSVHVSRIGKYQNSVKALEMDLVSAKYVQNQIKNQPIDQLKSLVTISEYLKIDLLKGVLCTHLALLNFQNYDEIKMKQKLKEKGIEYSRHEEINLMKKLKRYAQQTSKELLQNMIQKQESMFAKR